MESRYQSSPEQPSRDSSETDHAIRILLVEPDPELVEMLVASLAMRFDAHISCVCDARSALDVDFLSPHELVLTELALGDSSGLLLAEKLLSISARPIILLADEPTCIDTISAMRIGVRDVFPKPFPITALLESADRLLAGHAMRRQRAHRYHRMRELVRRVVRERKELNRRIELVCRDLVGAHKRLVHRIAESDGVRMNPPVG